MQIDDFDFTLPQQLIADSPVPRRDEARLLQLDRKTGAIRDYFFYELTNLLIPGDVLVLNNSKVFPARLIGQRELTGGKVEILLSKELEAGLWEVVGKGLKLKTNITFAGSDMQAAVIERKGDLFLVRFSLTGDDFFREIEKIGTVPIPPYIAKKRQETLSENKISQEQREDVENYQTVYAKDRGSVAAPTAGLHFTPELLDTLKSKGIQILEITLHVGLGTFAPVKAQKVEDHKIHSEYFSIKADALENIVRAKKEGRRIIAVGTTSARTLEHVFQNLSTLHSPLSTLSGWTNIYIYPGYNFKCIDGLITNFHIPKSSLLLLVSAFASREKILSAYQHAIENNYRFYSYGDAMLIT